MSLGSLSGTHTFESFLDIVKLHHSQENKEIRILAYVSDLQSSELIDTLIRYPEFQVRELGDIIEVRVAKEAVNEKTDQETHISLESGESGEIPNLFYFHYNLKRGLLLCFTTTTLDDAERIIGRFVNHTGSLFPLWIHPLTFDDIRRQIISENPDSIITEFHTRRYRRNEEDVIRPDYESRYFKYSGDDGRSTLDEISRAYGVLPISMVFIILNKCKFRITHMGQFVFSHGDLDFLFQIINTVLSRALETKKVIEKAKIEFIPVNMGKKEMRLPRVIPVDIEFGREIDFSEIEKMLDNMSFDDFNFEIFDMSLLQGSVHLSGTILDRNKNIAFNITGNSEKLTLSPRKDTHFDSMIHFYKMITEKLDINAKVRVSDQISR